MKNPEPFIVDILCKNADPMSSLEECHVIGCAITNSPEKALVMIQDRLISECLVTLFISSVQPNRSLLCQSSELEAELIQRAHQSALKRALMMIPVDEPVIPQGHITERYSYLNKMIN